MISKEMEQKVQEKAKLLNMEIIDFAERKKHYYVKLKCKTHYNKPEQVIEVSNFVNKQKTCGCRLKFYTKEDFIEDIKDFNIELIGDYINDGQKTLFKCKNGHEWETTPNKIKQGRSCPICKKEILRKRFIKSTKQFEKELEKSNPSIELVSEYNGANNEISYRCKVCGKISTSKADKVLRKESSCHFCKSSLGERMIIVFLEEHNIKYDFQKTFDGCVYKQKLYFDFYLSDFNLCVEFQGEQHYKPVDFSYTPTEESKNKSKENFEQNKVRDEIKRVFCKNNNINLLEISYKDINNISEILTSYLKL